MIHLGSLEEFAVNTTTHLLLDGNPLLIVRQRTSIAAYRNQCPHTGGTLDPMGGSVASEDGLLITCQRHGAQFRSDTGQCVAGPCMGESLEALSLTVENGELYLSP
ncbi:Rieske (2Fe-2S) protein [Halioglobus pacificus]|uniref:Rieske domain-containing protein n=1 Tax=Parahalioglobus pacificus TaxID=930806 RepID=A0A918XLH2_9GAMM|nr:Rieske 2Fe-2S domain-containing protein [Halioglobus pacificus]GHD37392.1 hypothetical protein GCM10007053_26920 [Halioglobus pacificus]